MLALATGRTAAGLDGGAGTSTGFNPKTNKTAGNIRAAMTTARGQKKGLRNITIKTEESANRIFPPRSSWEDARGAALYNNKIFSSSRLYPSPSVDPLSPALVATKHQKKRLRLVVNPETKKRKRKEFGVESKAREVLEAVRSKPSTGGFLEKKCAVPGIDLSERA